MSILPKELTIGELARQLGLTTKWVEKAIELLNLKGLGKGRKRIFSAVEAYIFEHVKLLRLGGLAWKELLEIRKRERKARAEMQSVDAKLYELVPFEKTQAHCGAISFFLTEPFLPTSILGSSDAFRVEIRKAQGALEKAALSMGYKSLDRIIDDIFIKHKLVEVRAEVQKRIADQMAVRDAELAYLKKCATSAQKVYRSTAETTPQ